MSTAVVAYQAASLNDRVAYANTLSAAGDLIPRGLRDPQTGKPSAPKILLVMETGSMLGLHPMAALQSIDVVEGRATLSAKLQKALITQAGHRMDIVKSGSIPGGDYSVTVTGTRADNGEVHASTWDIARGIRAGSVDSYNRSASGVWEVRARSQGGKPKPWEAYAENMPVWRAVSDVAREGFGDVLFGLYSTEEIRDGLPVNEPVEPTESTRDWSAEIKAADTAEQMEQIKLDLRETGEGTDELRTLWLEKDGQLKRVPDAAEPSIDVAPPDEDIVDAEVIDDEPTVEPPAPVEMTEAEYEAASAAAHAAFVAGAVRS